MSRTPEGLGELPLTAGDLRLEAGDPAAVLQGRHTILRGVQLALQLPRARELRLMLVGLGRSWSSLLAILRISASDRHVPMTEQCMPSVISQSLRCRAGMLLAAIPGRLISIASLIRIYLFPHPPWSQPGQCPFFFQTDR